jgi:multidrug resistance efflux pump
MSSPSEDRALAWEELTRLNQQSLEPREFWQRFITLTLKATSATGAAVLFQRNPEPWRVIASALRGASVQAREAAQGLLRRAVELAEEPGNEPIAVTAIPTSQAGERCLLMLIAPSMAAANDLREQARALAALPVAYEATHSLHKVEADVAKLTQVLDALLLTNATSRFGGSALALCNALATHFQCDRVSLGWHEGGYCRLQAMSRTEQFDRKMELVQRIEAAMDECLDQDEEIVLPAVEQAAPAVALDHAALAAAAQCPYLLSLPLRGETKLVGALTCERIACEFTAAELGALRLSLEAATPRLILLRQQDRWWGGRLWQSLKERASSVLGPRHTMSKLVALFITLLLAVLLFWTVDYRVEGTFLLRSDQAATLTSPFEGFIKAVHVEAGDHVTAGQSMLQLDVEPLRVEESSAMAELDRFRSEADKARASKAPAEMRIAEAMARQAQAKLDVIRFQLAQAEVKSPIAGVIIEGELKERLNAPVKQGDALFRIAQLGKLYVEFQLDERDAHLVAAGSLGEAAFVSQPDDRVPIKVDFVVPAAIEKDGVHAFSGKANFQSAERDWYRPGMSGICKIEAGRKSLLWVLTHRTIDFLRLKFWW